MPAKLISKPKRPLQVEPPPFLPHVPCGAGVGFGGHVDGEPVVPLVDHRQAHSGAGDRCAEIDRAHVKGAGDLEAQVAPLLGGLDPADVGDDSCKHGPPLNRSG